MLAGVLFSAFCHDAAPLMVGDEDVYLSEEVIVQGTAAWKEMSSLDRFC
jgi:hypothetical protein